MSAPNSAPPTEQPLVPLQPSHLAIPEEMFPSFALPEAVLHSIPLPAEFDQLVQLAFKENRVKSVLPSFFNPLFRRQGVLNKHTLHALESVGQSLAHLASEIESRDRVLEQFSAHLNAYGANVQRGQRGLTHFTERLASQVGEVTGKLQERIDHETSGARLRTDSLVAIARSLERRVGEQQAVTARIFKQIEDITTAAEQRDLLLKSIDIRLTEADQQAKIRLDDIHRATTALQAITQATDVRLSDQNTLSSEIRQHLNQIQTGTEQRDALLKDLRDRLAETDQLRKSQLADLRQQFSAHQLLAQTAEIRLSDQLAAVADLNCRLEEMRTSAEHHAAVQQEQIARQAEADKQTEARFTEIKQQTAALLSVVRATDTRLTEQLTNAELRDLAFGEHISRLSESSRLTQDQLTEFRQQIAALQVLAQGTESRLADAQAHSTNDRAGAIAAIEQLRQENLAGLAILEKRTVTQLTEQRETLLREQNDRLASTIAGIEARLDRIEAGLTTKEQQGANQLEALLSVVRADSRGHQQLSQDMEALRGELCAVAEVGATQVKRQESMEVSLGSTKAALSTFLPILQAQLERILKTKAESRRQDAAGEALATVETTQLSEADALYVALEARFRGPRSVIRERQSKYLPVIDEARNRVGLFPPRVQTSTNQTSFDKLRVENGVLDLGCGRGEWLELLKEKGVPSLGVDRNRFFLESCRQRNCEVIDADIIDFLKNSPDESVTAVTSFHVIEHLPIPVFQEMTRQVLRVLRRGGAVVFETPNPGNVLTSCTNFLLDPTHLRPVHPEFARLVLETNGFSAVQLQFMSPYDASYKVGHPDDPLAQKFNDYFYGPQDYAVIGVKP